ncbi:MAG TPA: alpha/beta fold hydrolase [Candidatus Elarobacter sp.]|nr:alpha/beta fold hydrolase [Candidatus Elarobacter sp.]
MILGALVLLCGAPPAAADSAPSAGGYWEGALVRSGRSLPVAVDLHGTAGGRYTGSFTAQTQAVMEYPLDSVTVAGPRVAMVIGGGDLRLDGIRDGATIRGRLSGDEGSGTFALHRVAAPVLPYETQEVAFTNHGVTLRGTLCLPHGSRSHPAVVLLHGSGPQTRWGTNRFIADRLARAGIAALAYDKRGSGDSTGDWRTVGYDALADDAIAGMELLAKRHDIDRARIGIWGHSQGAFIAPLVAQRSRHVAFIVAADGNASTNQQQDLLRARNQIRDNGWTGADGAEALAVYKQFIAVASAGGAGYDALEQRLRRDKERPWVNWIGVPPRSSWLYRWYPLVVHYDSRVYWRKVRVPVLLVYGEHDELSDVPGSIATIRHVVSQAGGVPVRSIVIAGAPHNLHIGPAKGQPFFWQHIAVGYPSDEIRWIRRVTGL